MKLKFIEGEYPGKYTITYYVDENGVHQGESILYDNDKVIRAKGMKHNGMYTGLWLTANVLVTTWGTSTYKYYL